MGKNKFIFLNIIGGFFLELNYFLKFKERDCFKMNGNLNNTCKSKTCRFRNQCEYDNCEDFIHKSDFVGDELLFTIQDYILEKSK